ncbi:hypothetical protein LguiB_024511 [Lonicera macranthoides]
MADMERGGCSRKCEGDYTTATNFYGAQQTSADMLRNTPSNIRRLADEIEQCEGRQKYLAHTISPSDGGDVRWYFCKTPLGENELAASVPLTEIVGKSDYFRFGMRDSLAIEASFLQREEELLSTWWKEYAECSVGPGGSAGSKSKRDPQLKGSSLESARPLELYDIEEERVGVPVKGGLYEVDLVRRHSFPVYWSGENRRVLRGHWFARKGGLDWLPLREDVSEQLEFAYRGQVWHRRTFQPSGLFAARVDLQGSTGLHALFTGEDDTWEAWLNVDDSGFSSVISLGGKGIKLRRGYAPSKSPKPTEDEIRQQKEEEMDDYCSQVPVRHLVFMVHGIGQRLEKSNLVDDVTTFRGITASMAERHLTSYQRGRQRILFIPCQWRKYLKLSGETAVEKCTLDGVRGLRVTLSATVHDVLYYMSPIYCQDIIDSVSNQLNRLYLKFLKRNPGYDGKVSLYGHSLGSVLSYDILCHQENLSSPFPMDGMYKENIDNEKSSPKTNNHTSEDNFTSSLVGKHYALNDESEGIAGSTDIDVTNAPSKCSVLVEEQAEDSFTLMGPSVSSDCNEHLAETMDCKHPSEPSSSSDEDVVQPVDKRETVSGNTDGLNESTRTTSGVLACDSNEVIEEVSHSDIDTTIKSLREEVVFLRARIKELESQSDPEGNEQETASVRNQTISEKLPSGKPDALKSYTTYINYTKLEFKVDTFFAVGSPLGVFLALRNVRIGIGKGQEYWWDEESIIEEMPTCRQMMNIFHPFDPVAYRIEPLICKDYLHKRPVIIPYHKGGKRLHIGFQEFAEDLASRSQAIRDNINYAKVKVLTLCESRNNDIMDEASDDAQQKEERSYGSLMIERLTGTEDGRIDHVLQDKTFQHPYISALGAHTNYWRDYDTALFILKHLYRDIPDEPNSPNNGISKHETGSDRREVTEEELPLTFSNREFVRNFSKKANKKIIKR